MSVLPHLTKGGQMERQAMKEWLNAVLDGQIEMTEISAVLTLLSFRGETGDELAGALDSLREHLTPFILPEPLGMEVFDTCGTGGDASGSFNISTTTAIVLAGAGIPVVKHGNRAISSRSGSADVLEALGVRIDISPESAREILMNLGVTFLWAPLYHPALKMLAPLRKSLAIRTLFNLVAPLANPALVRRQMVGVPSLPMVQKISSVLSLMGHESFCVMHGDGLDEATLAGPTTIVRLEGGQLYEKTLNHKDFNLPFVSLREIRGGTALENAEILRKVLKGTPGPFLDVTIANAALGFWTCGRVSSPAEGANLAREVIFSRKPLEILDSWIDLSKTIRS
ncbi:MAG: anthranilate phosphoribosyltransferase [Leptospirillum sp.]